LCLTPELAVEITLQPIRRFGFDGAILFSDILVVPYALGRRVAFVNSEGPLVEPVNSAADLDALDPGGMEEKLGPVYETVRLLARELPAQVALIGFAGAPWTVATYLVEGGTSRGFARARDWAYGAPKSFGRLIDMLVAATSTYLNAQIAAGAEAVQLFDSWAGVLDDPGFDRWVIAPTGAIVKNLKAAHPHVPVIGFPRGAGLRYERYVEKTGVDGIGLDAGVPLDYARDRLQARAVVQGNLDPRRLAAGGEALAAEVQRICTALGRGPFIFNLGHGIEPDTPIENVERLVALVREKAQDDAP
jgi:uroporphyrinogen decarboxylase